MTLTSIFSQYSSIFSALDKSNPTKLKLVKLLQSLNILLISVGDPIDTLVKFKLVKLSQPKNNPSTFSILEFLQPEIFKETNEEQKDVKLNEYLEKLKNHVDEEGLIIINDIEEME